MCPHHIEAGLGNPGLCVPCEFPRVLLNLTTNVLRDHEEGGAGEHEPVPNYCGVGRNERRGDAKSRGRRGEHRAVPTNEHRRHQPRYFGPPNIAASTLVSSSTSSFANKASSCSESSSLHSLQTIIAVSIVSK